MRVVSLTCSNTEIVCALGCAAMLVGVDDHSDYPADVVARLARVGPDLGIDIQRVAALKPDLVLASLTVPGHEKIIAALEQAQLPFIAPEPVSVDDIYNDISQISQLLGCKSRGDELIEQMRRTLSPIHASNSIDHTPSALVQWWPKPVIAPARQSWVNALFDAVGLHNPLAERDVKSTPLEDSEVVALNPDAIIISWCGVKTEKYRPEVVYRNPAWQDLEFVRQKRVYCVPEAYLGRPSPRLLDGHRALVEIAQQLRAQTRAPT